MNMSEVLVVIGSATVTIFVGLLVLTIIKVAF